MAAESAVRIIFLGDSASAVRSVSRLEGAFGGLGRTTRLVAGALGIALVGGMVAATKSAIDFQHQMELIHTQAGASTKEVEKMSKAVLGLAASVGTGPEDLAKGLFHIESAGIRGAHALQILKAAAEGAKIGGADLEDTTNALIGAFKSGVKGAGSMEHAMAVLNATVGAGNMRMSDLTAAMGTGLLSAAKGVGISIQDVGAAVSELTVQNENASEAATRLQMAFLTMAAGTDKGNTALKSIGITQFQLANDMRSRGLIFALQDLQDHLVASGKTATEQNAIIADVFGRRSLKAILPLLQHLDDVRKRQEQINKTTSNFGDAWTATQQTVTFQLARARAAIQAAAIPLGTLLLPLVAKVASAIAVAANNFGEFVTKLKEAPGLAGKFKVIADGARGMADAIGSALSGVDWSKVGNEIAVGISKGIKIGAQFAQQIVAAMSDALGNVNWDQLARKAGPLIVTALASAISAATDPSFWIHHWDLALAVALVAFGGSVGKIAGRLGELLLRPFARLGERFAVIAGDIIVKFADRLPRGLAAVFRLAADLAFRALYVLSGKAADVGEAIVSGLKSRVAKLPGLLRFTFKVLGVDAAIHAIGQFAAFVVAKVGQAIQFVVSALGKIPGAVRSAFAFTPVGAAISMIQTLIHWIQTLIGWIQKIPDINFHVHLPSLPTPHLKTFHGIPYPTFAEGGFVAGQSGSPQMVLAHAGEVILNPMQQAAFGGASFFKQTFGFSEGGTSFAAGGIVGKPKRRHAGKSPHHPRHGRGIKAKSKAVKGILSALDEIDENEGNADRAYGQLVRQFDISQEQFIRTDPSGHDYISKPDIDQRVSEIDQLIVARNNYLALLDEEKKELELAIKKLKAAIHALVRAIKREREQAAQDALAIRSLGRQLGHTKGAQAKARIQNQITARGNSRSKHLSNVGTLQGTLGDFKGSLNDVQENLGDTLPMDVRDVQLDVTTLQAERKDVVGTTLPSSGSPGGGGGGSTDSSAMVAELIAQIARLNLALGIQTAQQGVLGSFAKGTLNVPYTGPYELHAGEQVIPAGRARRGEPAAPSQPHVEIYFEKGLEWLEGHTKVIVDGRMAEFGRAANERARSGRY